MGLQSGEKELGESHIGQIYQRLLTLKMQCYLQAVSIMSQKPVVKEQQQQKVKPPCYLYKYARVIWMAAYIIGLCFLFLIGSFLKNHFFVYFNQVCLEKLNDIQLALVIARLYESEFETSGTYKSILQKRILGSKPHSTESPLKPHFDPFLRSMAYWILEEYGHALDTLLSHPTLNDEGKLRQFRSTFGRRACYIQP